jgi:hypothetical protein
MPHIPRGFASTRGLSPELGSIPRKSAQKQAQIPYRGNESDGLSGEAKGESNKNSMQQEAISPNKWDVDTDNVFAFLFGKDTLEKSREDVEKGHGE